MERKDEATRQIGLQKGRLRLNGGKKKKDRKQRKETDMFMLASSEAF